MSAATSSTSSSSSIRTLHSILTQCNADSIEFIPSSYASPSDPITSLRTFVCGNYQLNEKTREKIGMIYLWQMGENGQRSDDAYVTHEEKKDEQSTAAASTAAVAASSSAVPSAAASFTPRGTSSLRYPLQSCQILDTSAIFDLKWCPRLLGDENDRQMLLGQVDAAGQLIVYRYQHGDASNKTQPSLTTLHTQQVATNNASCLSLDWNNRVHHEAEPTIAISQSDSRISLVRYTQTGVTSLTSWTAHEFEMWIVAYNSHSPHILYSGADDNKLRAWDVRVANTGIRSALFTDSSHEMGVCSIASHPTNEFLLATGSYDEKVRIWDTRYIGDKNNRYADSNNNNNNNINGPLVTHSLGGGAWRVRWHPDGERNELLCCAMHNGFAVVKVGVKKTDSTLTDAASATVASTTSPFTITASTRAVYKEHESLAYGADWCAAPLLPSSASSSTSSSSRPPADLIATCSFYDKQMNVWALDRETIGD